MKSQLLVIVCLAALMAFNCAHAQDRHLPTREELLKLEQGLKYQNGEIELRGGLAKLNVPKDFKYLGPDDAETVLVKMWGNPPGPKELGLLMPADKSPLKDGCWIVTLSYEEEGYVKDNDAGKINYDDLLNGMKKQVHDDNPKRQEQGYPTFELVGWAAPPHYDASTHKLYWAKELKFAGGSEDTLNYNIRILGRRGVLVLNAVAAMPQLPEIEKETPQILGMVNFNDGHRYTDFDPKVDKVATYGIAALVAGGIAAKLGFFKLVWVFLLAAKKFIIIGVVAMAGWIKKLFGKGKKVEPSPPATLPDQS